MKHEHSDERLALFSGAYNHIADGVAKTLNRFVEHLEERDIPVRIIAPTTEEPVIDHAGTLFPAPSIPVPGRPEYRMTYGFTEEIRDELDRFQPSIIQIATPDLLGLKALWYAHKHDIPVAATYHTDFPSYLKYYNLGALEPLLWSYLRYFYKRCDHIYVSTEAVRNRLHEHGITDGVKLWTRGTDTTEFSPTGASDEWKQRYGIDDKPVVLFVSRLVKEKGLETLTETLQLLEERGIDHTSVIVGDGPARPTLEKRLPNTVFTGFLRGDELCNAYAAADVFFFPSDTETFGKVTLEAMASATPTVCADALGSQELVEDGSTGYLCPPGDANAFTERIAQLLTDEDERERMAQAARQRAERYHREDSIERVLEHHEELLQ